MVATDHAERLSEREFDLLRLTVRRASRRLSSDQVVTLADDLHAVRRLRRRGDPLSEPPSFLDRS